MAYSGEVDSIRVPSKQIHLMHNYVINNAAPPSCPSVDFNHMLRSCIYKHPFGSCVL
jgi:hypothetical protein